MLNIEKMKYTVFLALLLASAVFLACCSKDNGESGAGITLTKTIPGGCNKMKSGILKSTPAEERDTVIFSLRKDTLVLFTGINYICCAPFKTKTDFKNDSLIVTLTDDCDYPKENCYCKCMCYYTWEFLFSGYQDEKKQGFKVILDDPRQKEPAVIIEGPVKL
jgi:hypothetical protein